MLISTPEHAHSPMLKMAAEAGKDAYVEKPMGNVLSEAKAARDAVVQARRSCRSARSTAASLISWRRMMWREAARSATSAKLKSCGTITGRAGADVRR